MYPNGYSREVLIDDKHWDRINKYHWYCFGSDSQLTQIVTTIDKIRYKLPNFILNLPNNLIIDHKDGNRENNQEENLRPCTKNQNHWNSGLYANNTSGYKGVTWDKSTSRWLVQIRHYNKKIYVMRTKNPIEGAKAYNAKAIELFGEFARLNIIPDNIKEINRG
jgi:hypothetical protein